MMDDAKKKTSHRFFAPAPIDPHRPNGGANHRSVGEDEGGREEGRREGRGEKLPEIIRSFSFSFLLSPLRPRSKLWPPTGGFALSLSLSLSLSLRSRRGGGGGGGNGLESLGRGGGGGRESKKAAAE